MLTFPTLDQLMQRARGAFRTNLPGTDAWLFPNNIYVTAKVLAGYVYAMYGKLKTVITIPFISQCPDDYIAWHAADYGIARKPAALANGNVIMSATAAASIVSGAVLQRLDGVRYVATQSATLNANGGTVSVPITALVSGASANAPAGTALVAISGITGAPTFALDASGIVSGANVESFDAWRARIWFRKRNPPQGGCPADYVSWGMQIAGVTRVFVERIWNGAGTVRVFPLTDGTTANGIPAQAVVQALQNLLALDGPSAAIITVAAANAYPINVIIANLSPNTTTVQNAIVAELQSAFIRRGKVSGSDTNMDSMPYLASPQKFDVLWIAQAIANAVGTNGADLIAPVADTTIPAGSLATLGTVTFQ